MAVFTKKQLAQFGKVQEAFAGAMANVYAHVESLRENGFDGYDHDDIFDIITGSADVMEEAMVEILAALGMRDTDATVMSENTHRRAVEAGAEQYREWVAEEEAEMAEYDERKCEGCNENDCRSDCQGHNS